MTITPFALSKEERQQFHTLLDKLTKVLGEKAEQPRCPEPPRPFDKLRTWFRAPRLKVSNLTERRKGQWIRRK